MRRRPGPTLLGLLSTRQDPLRGDPGRRELSYALEIFAVVGYLSFGIYTAEWMGVQLGWRYWIAVVVNIIFWPITLPVAFVVSKMKKGADPAKDHHSQASKKASEQTLEARLGSLASGASQDEHPASPRAIISVEMIAELFQMPEKSAALWHKWLCGDSKTLTLDRLKSRGNELKKGRNVPGQNAGVIFDVFDTEKKGALTTESMAAALSSCCVDDEKEASGKREVDGMVQQLVGFMDADRDGLVRREELVAAAVRFPTLFDSLLSPVLECFKGEEAHEAHGAGHLHPGEVAKGVPHDPHGRHVKGGAWLSLQGWLQLRPMELGYLIAFCLLVTFVWVYQFRHVHKSAAIDPHEAGSFDAEDGFGWAYIVARASGAALNPCAALVLLPVCGKYMTFLRNSSVGRWLPLDKTVEFHRLLGTVIFGLSALHTLAHFINYRCCWQRYSLWQHLTSQDGFRHTFTGLTGLTGSLLIIILTIMFVCALPCIRRTKNFQVFYVTHMLWLPWFVCLFLHAPNCWKWMSIPVGLYLVDRVQLLIAIGSGRMSTKIRKLEALKSDTTRLEIVKPRGFDFIAGEYVFINIPRLSRLEWHPFTISSSPQEEEVFTLHVRALGDWTKALNSLAKEVTSIDEVDVLVQGPYGAPSEAVWNHEHVVLVAAGIGVTPFSSIIQTYSRRMAEREIARSMADGLAEQCKLKLADETVTKLMKKQLLRSLCAEESCAAALKTEKIDFVWVNKELGAFSWFMSLLTQVEADAFRIARATAEKGGTSYVNTRLYLTGDRDTGKIQKHLLEVVNLVYQEEQKVGADLGASHPQAYSGRPDWQKLFQDIQAQDKGRVCVCFCGPEIMAKDLFDKCQEFGFTFHKENF